MSYTPLLAVESGEDSSGVQTVDAGSRHNLVYKGGSGSIGVYFVTDGAPVLASELSGSNRGFGIIGPIDYQLIRHEVESPSGAGYYE